MIAPLTSIRLIFILMIFLFHCHVPYSENMGCYGVSFFFILSGFVLSLSYKQKVLSNDFNLLYDKINIPINIKITTAKNAIFSS